MYLSILEDRLFEILRPRLIIDAMRVGAFTSRVWVELVWLCEFSLLPVSALRHVTHSHLAILWVLWVASAAETANFFQTVFGGSCGFINPITNASCMKVQAVMAFAFLAWLTR